MFRPLERFKKDFCNFVGQAEGHEGEDYNRVRDSVVASLCIIHSHHFGTFLLSENIAQEFFVKASHCGSVSFSAAVLVI